MPTPRKRPSQPDNKGTAEPEVILLRTSQGKTVSIQVDDIRKVSRLLNLPDANDLLNILSRIIGGQDMSSLLDSFMDSENVRIRAPQEAAFQDGARFLFGQILFLKNIKPKPE